MSPDEIAMMAVDPRGDLVCATRDGRIAILADDRLEPLGPQSPDPYELGAMAAVGSDLVASAPLSRCLLRIPRSGPMEVFAGTPVRADTVTDRTDGTTADARFARPTLLAANGVRLYVVDGMRDAVLRFVERNVVRTLHFPPGAPETIAGMAAMGPDLLAVTGADRSALVVLSLDGTTPVTTAGRAGELGGSDGRGGDARFARITALCSAPQAVVVADGARLRRVTADGSVTTLAGGAPGDLDGPAGTAQFSGIAAIAVRVDGAIYVGDTGNGSIRLVSAAGFVSTLLRARAPQDPSTLSEGEASQLSRALGEALVSGDDARSAAIVARFLADHRRRGDAEPDRSRMPVSVASARVGRTLARSWCFSADVRRTQIGAFCLWLIRFAEGAGADPGDAVAFAAALARALDGRAYDEAQRLVDAIGVAFGDLAVPRDRAQLRRACASEILFDPASELVRSGSTACQTIGLQMLEILADARSMGLVAPLALGSGNLAPLAARALTAALDDPASGAGSDVSQKALRFAAPTLIRLLDEGGSLIDAETRARLRELLGRL